MILALEPALILAALAGLLLLLLWDMLIRPTLNGTVGRIPVPGIDWGHLFDAMRSVVQSIVDGSLDWSRQIFAILIGDPISQALNSLQQSIAWAGTITSTVWEVGRTLAGNAANLAAQAATLASHALSIAGLSGALDSLATQLAHAVTVAVPGLIHTAVLGVEQVFGRAIDTLTAKVDAIPQQIDQAATNALGQAETYVDGQVAPLNDLLHGVDALGGVATIAATIAGVGTIATELTRVTRDCIEPTCNARPYGLDLFTLLGQGAEIALVAELVVEAVEHPHEAAVAVQDGADELVGLARPVLGAFGVSV